MLLATTNRANEVQHQNELFNSDELLIVLNDSCVKETPMTSTPNETIVSPTITETPPTTTETPPTDHLFPVVSFAQTTKITSASTYPAVAASTTITAWPQVSIPERIFEETFRRSSSRANGFIMCNKGS